MICFDDPLVVVLSSRLVASFHSEPALQSDAAQCVNTTENIFFILNTQQPHIEPLWIARLLWASYIYNSQRYYGFWLIVQPFGPVPFFSPSLSLCLLLRVGRRMERREGERERGREGREVFSLSQMRIVGSISCYEGEEEEQEGVDFKIKDSEVWCILYSSCLNLVCII